MPTTTTTISTPPTAVVDEGEHNAPLIQARQQADIRLHGEIGAGGITARQFAETLSALGPVSDINLHIHSPGGDVFDGIAIYNLLKNHPARKTVYIDGFSHCDGG